MDEAYYSWESLPCICLCVGNVSSWLQRRRRRKPPPKLTSFIVSPTNVSLAANTTANLIATGTYSDGKTSVITTQVTWTSAASGVASVGVNSGLVTAGSASGKTTITATLNGFADQLVNITVTAFGGIVITSNSNTVISISIIV